MYPTREEAWEIFTEYNKDEHLIKHGLTDCRRGNETFRQLIWWQS